MSLVRGLFGLCQWIMDGVGRGFLLTGGFGLLYLDNEISFDFNFLITEF